jgi:hypothetical protein
MEEVLYVLKIYWSDSSCNMSNLCTTREELEQQIKLNANAPKLEVYELKVVSVTPAEVKVFW